MNALNKIFLLNDINFIFAVVMVVMSFFIYCLKKYPIYISFIIVYFIEAILFMHFRFENLNNYRYISLEAAFIIKILSIIVNRNNFCLSNRNKFFLFVLYTLGLIITDNHVLNAQFANLLGNVIIFYNFICKFLYRINSDLIHIETSVLNKEKYIKDLNEEICIAFRDEESLEKKEQELKNIYDVFIPKLDLPVFILKDKKIIYKNDEFNNLFEIKHLEEFDINSFFKNYFFYGGKISNSIKTSKEFLKLDITSFKENTYQLFVVDIINVYEKLKLFAFYDNTNIFSKHKKEYKQLIDATDDQEVMVEDIEEREKIYRVLLETLPEGIIFMDKNTKKYIYRNKYILEKFKKLDIKKFNNIVEDYISEGQFDIEEIINLNKKERASITVTCVQNIYIIIFKILENSQKQDNTEQNIEKIKETEDFKTKFCTNVVDKIEEPINDMLYENKLMEEKSNNEIIHNHLFLVRQNLYRFKKILNNIHEIMNIENGAYDLNYVVFDIVQLVKDIVNLSKNYIDKKELNIELQFSDEEILVYLDSQKMQKIILNILSNAMKFTEKYGNIKISVNKKIDFIVIEIKDDGIGIPKEKINFIFENFKQIDKSLSRLAEGMGMGLYLTNKLAEIQGIYLNVDSKINEGSEFKILIKNIKSIFLINKYKENIYIDKESIDIQFSDIYQA